MNRKEAIKGAKTMKEGGFSDQNVVEYLQSRPDFKGNPKTIVQNINGDGHGQDNGTD